MNKLKLLLGFIILLSSSVTSATIIDNGDYTTINGVNWLDLSKTAGMTLAGALAQNEGYRLANEKEYEAMFNLFNDPNDTKFFDIDAGVSGGNDPSYKSWYVGEDYNRFLDNSFMKAFGVTLTTVVPPSYFEITYSYGLYDDLESDYLQLGGADVSSPGGSGGYAQIQAINSGNYYDSTWSQRNLGFF